MFKLREGFVALRQISKCIGEESVYPVSPRHVQPEHAVFVALDVGYGDVAEVGERPPLSELEHVLPGGRCRADDAAHSVGCIVVSVWQETLPRGR